MAEIVARFVCPHSPPVFADPLAQGEGARGRVDQAFREIRDRVEALAVDTVVVVASDHYVLFGPSCLPSALIGIGDVWGPIDRLPGIERGPIANNEPFARHIFETARDQGVDLAVAKSLKVDHSVGIPVRLGLPAAPAPRVVPIYLASGVDPMIRPRRAFQIGQAVAEAAKTWAGAERIAVIGSGGISHTIGMPGMGRVNPEFDRWVLDCWVRGDAEALIELTDEEVLAQGGNGAFEIRNFLTALGALPDAPGRCIAYEPAPAWFTGLGFAEAVRGA